MNKTTTTEEIPCPACEGIGYFVENDIEPECCGNPTKYGSCCGNAVPKYVAVQKPCSYCGGYGTVPDNHEEL